MLNASAGWVSEMSRRSGTRPGYGGMRCMALLRWADLAAYMVRAWFMVRGRVRPRTMSMEHCRGCRRRPTA